MTRFAGRLAVLAFLASVCAGCVMTSHGDYFDFIRYGEVTYRATHYQQGRELTDADLGTEQFRVKRKLADSPFPAGQVADGDAAFVPSGTPVYAVRGYAPTFRLAARHDGRLMLYEADINPAAKRGADLLDLEGKVRSIALLDLKYGRTVVSRLSDPVRIAAIVQEIGSANVDQSYSSTPRWATIEPTPPIQPNSAAIVVFELADGTATVRGYDLAGGVLQRGIQVAGRLRDAVRELVAAAPTPSPVPATVNLARIYDLARATRVSIKDPERSSPVSAAVVSDFAAALDRELPARRGQRPSGNYAVVIFSFPDRVVSIAYEPSPDLLTVVVPDDELSVTPSEEFRRLLGR